jgi:hypothetical protein
MALYQTVLKCNDTCVIARIIGGCLLTGTAFYAFYWEMFFEITKKLLFRNFRYSNVRFATQLHIRAVSGYYCSLREVMTKLNLPVH